MACFGPLAAWYGKEINPATGKRRLVFKKQDAAFPAKVMLPCGRCSGCRLESSRQWAMRCMHEKKLHSMSSFLTLTYDDNHLPEDGSLSIPELQRFLKRLRHLTGDGLRFYACGEYGETTLRPHYHVLLLNYDFDDRKRWSNSKTGRPLFTSSTLDRYWTNGLSVIGDVDFDSCAYVARYIMKKRKGPDADAFYTNRDGVVVQPEFTTMSRNPGIGTGYFEKYKEEIYRRDSVVVNGREVRPPRFYDNKFELISSDRLAELKVARRKLALDKPRSEDTNRRRVVREIVEAAKLKQKGRTL